MTKIACLCWLTFDIFNYKPHTELRAPIFQNQGSFLHALSQTKSVTPNFIGISDTSNSLSDCSKNLKNLWTEKF